jgi:UDP-2,3-diacylglucosamine hydrolase
MSSSSAPSSSDDAVPGSGAALASSLIASAQIRSVEFVSDLHLAPDTPRTVAAFERYLASTAADMVVVLGDLFEVWIGDDFAGDACARRCLDALHRCARTRIVAMMVGNRDFLLGGDLLAGLGVIAIDDPTVLDAWGRNVVLSHGDALCLDDHDYQRFRREVRTPAWRRAFLARPRTERAVMARAMRDASRARQGEPSMIQADADPAATLSLLDALEADVIVHGHTHRPFCHQPAVTGASMATTRHVTSDWDLDGPSPRAEVLRLTPRGFERVAPPGVVPA